MGLTVTKAKFHFSYTDEPHATRRQQILKAHPEIKQLFGIDPSFKYVVIAQVLTQILIAYLIRSSEWPLVLILAYAAGGTFNHSLSLAVHELSHNTAFGSHRPLANRILGIIANLPMFVPMSVTFKKYHLEHHRYLGEDEIDTDIPTEWEAKTFDTTGKKAVWLFLQPVFYGFRPMALYKKAITDLELVNTAVQVTFDVLVIYFWGWKSAAYLFLGLALGLGIHPCSGHYISDHYVFSDDHAHPEIKQLFGIDPSFKYVVIGQVLTQILIAYLIRSSEWPLVLILAYAAGGTFNHSLSLAVHELSHNTAFGSHRPLANRILGIIANLPMFVPMSVTFKKYHLEHHRYLGEDEIDTDIPTEWEAKTFDTTGKKAVWLFLQPVFYGFRPMALYKKAITDLELVNTAVQVTFDVLVIYFWGWKSAAYLFLGLALGLGIHPCSGHYISDHYVFSDDHVSVDFLGDFGNHMESGFRSPV